MDGPCLAKTYNYTASFRGLTKDDEYTCHANANFIPSKSSRMPNTDEVDECTRLLKKLIKKGNIEVEEPYKYYIDEWAEWYKNRPQPSKRFGMNGLGTIKGPDRWDEWYLEKRLQPSRKLDFFDLLKGVHGWSGVEVGGMDSGPSMLVKWRPIAVSGRLPSGHYRYVNVEGSDWSRYGK